MPVTFLHTADWQLGKPFASVEDDDKRALIRQERIKAIERIGLIAEERNAAFILVAGDLFDSPTASKSTVSAACSNIGQLEIPVIVIPGNHDHGGPGCLWEQEFFLQEAKRLASNLKILLKAEPLELNDVVIFPCPLPRRHESSDPTSWLRDIDNAALKDFDDNPRIDLAHGSIQGFDSSGDEEDGIAGAPNLIDLDLLSADSFDYIALGDWHGTKEVGGNAWYSGTPEIDRFPKGWTNEPGNVLLVTADRGESLLVETIRSNRLGWHQFDFEFASDDDLDTLDRAVADLIGNRASSDLLRLSLRGSLGLEATTQLESLLDSYTARLLRLKLANQTLLAPTEEEIEALTRRSEDPLIAMVAGKLVELADGSDEEAAVARVALRELHAVCTKI